MILLNASSIATATGATNLQASQWVTPLQNAIERYSITSPARVAAFLAQVGVESARLTAVEENLNYRADTLVRVWPNRYRKPFVGERIDIPQFSDGKHNASFYGGRPADIANLSYGGRLGNGPIPTGEGYKYRGRGLIQLTGKNNYQACGKGLNIDLIGNPDLLLTKPYAAMSAGWFWDINRLNVLADAQSIDAISKKVNGGEHGLAERRSLFQAGLKVFSQG